MKKLLLLLALVIGLFAMYQTGLAAVEKGLKPEKSLTRVTQDHATTRTLVNIGQIAMWIQADGKAGIFPFGNAAGTFYPRGSTPATAFIYQDGLIWGGYVRDGSLPEIRVGGQEHASGTDPGAILSKGVAENPNDRANVNRIWRIRRDFATVPDEALRQDAAEFFNASSAASVTSTQIQEVREIYRADWLDWPTYKGAPFYDADGDGQYQPQLNADGSPRLFPEADEPGYADADQVVWFVVNDLNPATAAGLYGSPPIGIETQCTCWAYRRTDAMGYIIFREFRLIYKGRSDTPLNAIIDSMYVSQWSDPDVGQSGDDFAGCDTTLSLGYAYNSTSQDPTYQQAGYPPPAGGYDFFAGPRVPYPGGKAIWHLKVIDDYINLPMTSFAFFASGQEDSDPDLRDYQGTIQWWNLLRGYRPRPESPAEPWTNRVTGERTMFRVPGDPVNGTGWIDSGTGDRRLLLVSGPFQLALGDTTEVVTALIGAMGSDRLSSVSVLKFYDRFAQEAFDVAFNLPKAPPSPNLMATEMAGQIILNWGVNADAVRSLENFDDKGFKFEGYNVYQLPSAGASVENGLKLATYDLENEITTILQESFDPPSGQILDLPAQVGKNTGVTRSYSITVDRLRELPLANGRTYYFAVSAYSYNPDPSATTRTLESTLAVATVTPQTAKPGIRYPHELGELLEVTHDGVSDGRVTVEVVDPTKTTGHMYSVTFDTISGGNVVWNLTDETTGTRKLKHQTNQSGNGDYITVDGLMVKVMGPAAGFHGIWQVANANGPIPGCDADPNQDIMWIHWLNAPDNPVEQAQGGYIFVTHGGGTVNDEASFNERVIRNDNAIRAIPYDYEVRFTAAGGSGYMRFTTGTVVPVPFELWNIGINTWDDPSDDFRLIPGINDVDEDDTFSFSGDDPSSGGENDPASDWIYWYEPLDKTPGTAGYDAWTQDADPSHHGGEVFARTILMNWNRYLGGSGEALDPDAALLARPEVGTVLRWITNKPNKVGQDKFTFSTDGVAFDKKIALKDLDKITVFPNPYYGLNIVENDRFNRFVTFSHLPQNAVIRIFTIAGVLVRTIEKENSSQFATWNLLNEDGLPVASGIYLVHLELPDLDSTKTIKLAIVREQQFLPLY